MERQVSVGPDRPVKVDHLWRWTTFSGKFAPGPKRSIYVSTEISGNFGIMESTLKVRVRDNMFILSIPHSTISGRCQRIAMGGLCLLGQKMVKNSYEVNLPAHQSNIDSSTGSINQNDCISRNRRHLSPRSTNPAVN